MKTNNYKLTIKDAKALITWVRQNELLEKRPYTRFDLDKLKHPDLVTLFVIMPDYHFETMKEWNSGRMKNYILGAQHRPIDTGPRPYKLDWERS
jgi:hypothetical protein